MHALRSYTLLIRWQAHRLKTFLPLVNRMGPEAAATLLRVARSSLVTRNFPVSSEYST